jgi:mono/diheme cytochrome c family protein
MGSWWTITNESVAVLGAAGHKERKRGGMKRLMMIGAATAALAVMAAYADEPAAPDAKTTFETKCAICHGKDGKGATKMGTKLGLRDYTDPKIQETLKDEEMVKAIKEGIKKDDQTKMKAFGESLSDAQIKALVDYVRSLKAK